MKRAKEKGKKKKGHTLIVVKNVPGRLAATGEDRLDRRISHKKETEDERSSGGDGNKALWSREPGHGRHQRCGELDGSLERLY